MFYSSIFFHSVWFSWDLAFRFRVFAGIVEKFLNAMREALVRAEQRVVMRRKRRGRVAHMGIEFAISSVD